MTIRTVGIDLGKTVFHLVGLDEGGQIISKKRFSRSQLVAFMANRPSCLVGMEACCGSHLIARVLAKHGYDVRLIPAQFVMTMWMQKQSRRPSNDPRCVLCPSRQKTSWTCQALHRVRDRLTTRRTGVINQLRAFLLSAQLCASCSTGGFRKYF